MALNSDLVVCAKHAPSRRVQPRCCNRLTAVLRVLSPQLLQVVSQYAYVLWYVRSRKSSIAAAAAGRSHHHRRTSSAASAGAAAAVASG